MPGLADVAPSHWVIAAGTAMAAAGLVLVFISFRVRLNDLGEVLRGFLLGAGIALIASGMLYNVDYVPGSSANPLSQGLRNAGAPVPASLGDAAAKYVQQQASGIRLRLYYYVPVAAIIVLLAYGCATRRWFSWLFGDGFAQGLRGFATAALIPLAFLAVGNYTDFGKFRYGTYFNAYEFYHYYIGTKYAPEVGYSNMYNASLVADDETGARHKTGKKTIRDLSNGRHTDKELFLKKASEYKGRFTPERWQEFLKDIRFFKAELTAGRWNGMLSDKGYNGTPFWTMWVGGLLSENVDTGNRAGMMALALLDPLLITLAVLCVWRAFGIRAALLMLILIGTSYVMKFSHMKGAYLRTDFAMSLVIAVCMLKLNHYRTAGALMMYAALARVFPAVFFFGAGVKLLQAVLLHWRPSLRRLGAGMVMALALTAAFTLALHFGAPAGWMENLARAVPRLSDLLAGTALTIAFEAMAAGAAALGLTALWLFNESPPCRPYVRLFSSALAVLVLFSAAVLMDKRTGVPYVEDFAKKIGRHLSDLSPWRVGYKYLFINQPSIQNERLKVAKAEEPVPAPAAAKAPDGQADEHGDAPDEPETAPAAITPVTNHAPPGFRPARAIEDAYLDMRFAAEKAAAKTAEDEETATLGPVARLGATLFQFFKIYVPNIRGQIYKERAVEWYLTILAVLALSFLAVLGLKDHEALAWSFVPTFFLVAPTYYYYIMLAVPLLFFTSALERPARLLGAGAMLAMAMPGYYLYGDLGYGQQFATYYWHSVMYLGLALYMLLLAYGDSLAALFRFFSGKTGAFTGKTGAR